MVGRVRGRGAVSGSELSIFVLRAARDRSLSMILALPTSGDESLILVAAHSGSVEGRPKRLDDRDCPTALRHLRNQSTATWVRRRSTWRSTAVARPRSEPTLGAMSIGQHRCFGSKVSLVNTDRWSLESEVCTRVLPGTTAKWSS